MVLSGCEINHYIPKYMAYIKKHLPTKTKKLAFSSHALTLTGGASMGFLNLNLACNRFKFLILFLLFVCSHHCYMNRKWKKTIRWDWCLTISHQSLKVVGCTFLHLSCLSHLLSSQDVSLTCRLHSSTNVCTNWLSDLPV